ncbi:uncharacterized protein BYT42DRAFT_542171 [Radiomyces spectabilis]|uniref:uncharacterized protein n=1 Tax=Radiomyces spectabilis TaxID=64574 RepID=UPI0022211EA6|nr:uncharacterized protein BYT42DRAFT_542171 [Radiomyces spectabilis]KAI8393993.1 hypothetical protein BYT42DRAFT_542171 [Radiomyces spectabilis]
MFSKANPFDDIVASATDENLTSENWELLLGVCDKVSRSSTDGARDCVNALQKRFTHRSANVQLYALTLAEALVKNCDVTVHREISSRSFTNALKKLIQDRSTHESVRKRALEFIQMCSYEFRANASLGLMNEVYHSLRAEGVQFPSPQKPKKEYTQSELDKQKEEEELQLALALSLSESEKRSSYKTKESENAEPTISRVRALYDFQPTEQGELGFQKGDIIRVIESVYRDWWKGELRGKTGIFPVNYVEKIVDRSPADLMKEAQMEAEVMGEIRNVERLLEMLNTIDPRKDSFSDDTELQELYNKTLSIRPKLVKLIEKYSLKKEELVALNEQFIQARTMYDRMLGSTIARYPTSAVNNTYAMPPYGGYESTQPYSPSVENYQGYGGGAPAQPYGHRASYSYPQTSPSPHPQHQDPSQIQPPATMGPGQVDYSDPAASQNYQYPQQPYYPPEYASQPPAGAVAGVPPPMGPGNPDQQQQQQPQPASYPPTSNAPPMTPQLQSNYPYQQPSPAPYPPYDPNQGYPAAPNAANAYSSPPPVSAVQPPYTPTAYPAQPPYGGAYAQQ